MLSVHAPDTPRTRYTANLLLGELLGMEIRLVPDSEPIESIEGPALVYGEGADERSARQDTIFLDACGLLSRSGIQPVDPQPHPALDTLGLFPINDSKGEIPFDVLAATFFLVTRYEEYLNPKRDAHGRALPEDGVLFLEGFLRQPVVNHYAHLLADVLESRFPRLPLGRPRATACSTIDVDVAYAYRGRSAVRALAAGLRRPRTLTERIKVLAGRRRDPFDTFAWIHQRHRALGVPLTYFVLLREGRSPDRGIPPYGREMAELVRTLADHAEMGIHPSYSSNEKPALLDEEYQLLTSLAGRPVRKSRQHFLKLDIPVTYRRLIELGVTDDYSMGYASQPGFRAGIASPFPFYDLEAERSTGLTLHPITYMDGSLRHYLGLTPDEAMKVIDDLAASIRRSGGAFTPIWHNDSVSDHPPWAGWRRVFEHSIRTAADLQNSSR